MRQPQFCKFSSLWFPSTTSKLLTHQGVFGANQWQRVFGGKKKTIADFFILTTLVLNLAFLAVHFLWSTPDEWFEPLWMSFAGLFLALTIAQDFLSAWTSRGNFLNQIFQIDLWMGLLFLSLAFESGLPSTLQISILAFASFGWLQLRAIEVVLWKSKLKGRFKDFDLFWTDEGSPDSQILRLERILAFSGIVVASLVLILFKQPLRPSILIGACLPALLPWPLWKANALLARAEDLKLVCQNFDSFCRLRFADLLLCHQSGVLTTSEFKFRELWIDRKTEEFSEAEIKDVFRQLAQLSAHPISESVLAELGSSSRTLMKMNHFQVQEHLGISADFEDSKRHKAVAALSGLTWQKILQHEVSEEGMEKIREWKREKYWTSFLSLNRKVLAAVVLENPSRFPAEGLDTDRPIVVMSSLPHLASGVPENAFQQVCVNLLPLERSVQRKHWEERARNILEVKSAWDAKTTTDRPFEIRMLDQRDQLGEAALGILAGNLGSVCQSVRAAVKLNKDVKYLSSLMMIGTVSSCFLNEIPILALAMYALSLSWISRSKEFN